MKAERKNPQNYRGLEIAMLKSLQEGNLAAAESYLKKIWTNGTLPEGQKQFASGVFAFQKKHFSEACERARLSFTKGGDQLKSITLLGQALMRMEDYQGAVKCFRKAQEFSPKNLERLCWISEAEEQLGNEEAADQALTEAHNVDAGNDKVVSLETQHALKDGNIDLAKDLFRHAGDPGALVADLNNTGIAYIRTGEFDTGIQFYERTLQAIPEEGVEWKMKVSYNLALAYARQNKLEAARDLLTSCEKSPKFSVFDKMKNMLARLEKASKEGTPFALIANSSDPNKPSATGGAESPWENSTQTNEFAGVMQKNSSGTLLPGDHGCYLLFKLEPEEEAKLPLYLKELPTLKSVPMAS
jgi:tetratricopeptide (TPR) repeat protein